MSKKGLYLPVIALAACLAAAAAPYTIQKYRVAAPVKMMMPAMSDSVDNNGKEYEPANMLANPVNTDFKRMPSEVVTTDTTGRVALTAPQSGYEVIVMETNLRSTRFASGKMKVTSPARFEVLIDGESEAKKTTVEDSITAASTKEFELCLEPEADYQVTLKVLTEAGSKMAPEITVLYIPDEDTPEDITYLADPVVKKRFFVDDCVEGTRVSSTSISPDGKYLITRYREYLGPNKYRSFSNISEVKTGKLVLSNFNKSISWMPTGSRIYYVDDSRIGADLYVMSIPQMETKVLIKDVESDQVLFSPDEKYIVYYEYQKGEPETGIMRRIKSPDDRQPGNRDRYLLMRQEVATGNAMTLTFGTLSNSLLEISPDSKKILYMSSKETPNEWPFYQNSLIQMDLTTLATDTIVEADGALNGAVYSPDGKRVLAYGGPNMLDGINLNIGNHPIANDFDIQLAVIDLATGKATPLTRDFDPSVSGAPIWNHADGNIYFNAVEGFYQNLYKLSPVSGKFEKLPLKVDVVRNFDMGLNESGYISYVGSTLSNDGVAYLYNTKTRSNTLVADPLVETIGDIEFGKTEKWTFKASDGTEIDGEITLPPNFDPTKKYPLIVYYYGGTTPSNHRIDHPYNPNTFASRDYVVYTINPSGTIGYGQEFSARHVNAWGKRTAEDIIEGVKEFCKAHPFVDTKKIGCLGASYGGFMTQYLQTLTDIFAAAVSHAGISDVTSYWGEGYWGYSYNSVAAAKSYPWNNPKLFTEQGSLFNADKIHTPLLLLHGTEDTNVPIGESIQIFNALKILGRDVEFITVEGANHVVTDPDKRREWQNTIMAWFAKYLQDDPSWWDALYGD